MDGVDVVESLYIGLDGKEDNSCMEVLPCSVGLGTAQCSTCYPRIKILIAIFGVTDHHGDLVSSPLMPESMTRGKIKVIRHKIRDIVPRQQVVEN